jgi:hypothetical protein
MQSIQPPKGASKSTVSNCKVSYPFSIHPYLRMTRLVLFFKMELGVEK